MRSASAGRSRRRPAWRRRSGGAGVRTCGRQLRAALTRGQAWRGGGCGMCERHVSPPQTVGKRCSAHLPAAAPRPPGQRGNRSRPPPRPGAFPPIASGPWEGLSLEGSRGRSSLRGLHPPTRGGWNSPLGADPTQRRAWGAGGACGWRGGAEVLPTAVSEGRTFLVLRQAPRCWAQ